MWPWYEHDSRSHSQPSANKMGWQMSRQVFVTQKMELIRLLQDALRECHRARKAARTSFRAAINRINEKLRKDREENTKAQGRLEARRDALLEMKDICFDMSEVPGCITFLERLQDEYEVLAADYY